MYTLVATLVSLALLAQTAGSSGQSTLGLRGEIASENFTTETQKKPRGRVVNLVLPRELNADEALWLELKLGVIERGAEIEIETTGGKPLGVISPHGIRSGAEAGVYTVPVPPDAVCDNRLSLLLTLNHRGAKRAPTLNEVKSVRLQITSPVRQDG